jgi:hypothetical protein
MPAIAVAAILSHVGLYVSQTWLAAGARPIESYLVYLLATAGATLSFVGALRHARHPDSGARGWLIGVPLALQIAWIAALPTLSIDAYSYAVDAEMLHEGRSPYEHPVKEAEGTPLGVELARHGWRPVHGASPYGPAWTDLESAIAGVTSSPIAAVRTFKLVAAVAVVLSGLLLSTLAAPADRLLVLTAFLWNPAVIVETAGEGHNDALLVLTVLATLWTIRRRSPVLAAGALTIAVLTKYVPAIFALPCAAYLWRAGLLSRRAVALGALVAAALVGLLFYPVWAGGATFNGLRQIGYPQVTGSTTGVLMSVLPDSVTVVRLLRLATAGATAALVLAASWQVTKRPNDLARACALVAFLYVVLTSPMFWPWYMLLPIALFSLTGDLPLVCVMAVTSRVVAPFDVMRVHDAFTWTTEAWITALLGAWIPLFALVWQHARHWRPVPPVFADGVHLPGR